MTVVCGTDFSTNASEASQIAARIAHRRGENLLLVHVVQPAPADPAGDHTDFLRTAAATALENSAAELRALGIQVETDAVIGSPAHEIVAHAPDDTTLFVTGARGHSRAAHWLIGSVAERLARIVPHPLLVVRRGRELPIEALEASIRCTTSMALQTLRKHCAGWPRLQSSASVVGPQGGVKLPTSWGDSREAPIERPSPPRSGGEGAEGG